MVHPLEERIAALRNRLRRLLAVYGVGWLLTAGLAAALAMGLLDYLLHFQDRGIRVIASLTVWVAVLWVGYRFLLVPQTARLSNADLARRVQRRFPQLSDSLASAVEFLDQPEDDPRAGSAALRGAVIREVTAASAAGLLETLGGRPARRAAPAASAIGLLTLILAPPNATAAWTAAVRLIDPLGDVAWPQRSHLELRQRIVRVARGQAFEVEVVDRHAELPDVVRIHYRFTAVRCGAGEETEAMHFAGGAMVARRENVVRPFAYRVEGGDDQNMPWIPVQVMEPPAVASLSVTLVPPAYTGWPTTKAEGHLRALVGTRVQVSAVSTKPLRDAWLSLEDGRQVPARLAPDRQHLTIPADARQPFLIDKSVAYWFKLIDVDGLAGGSDNRWEIRAVPDVPPTVLIEKPSGTLLVTPNARVPLRVSAKDDLALRRIDLLSSRSDRPKQPDAVKSMYVGPERVQPQTKGLEQTEQGDRQVVSLDWDLAPLGLTAGTQVTFHVAADDYRPQTGTSEPRRLSVVTPEELTERIASRQAFLLGELKRVLGIQRQGRQQVAALEIRAGEIGLLDQLDLDHLRGVELNERQVVRTLSSRTDGLPVQIVALQEELENNRLSSPDVQRRMEAMLRELERLGREQFPVIARELTAAIKSSQIRLQEAGRIIVSPQPKGRVPPDPAVRESLATAGRHQDQVIATLETLIGELSRWDSYRRFHRDIAELRRDQEELGQRTTDLGRRTLAKEIQDLLPQEAADLKINARQQAELAGQWDHVQQEMQSSVAPLQESDPAAAKTVAAALHRAQDLAISGRMRSIGDDIQQNQMGRAIAQQKQVIGDLQQVLDVLADRRESQSDGLVRKLRRLESEAGRIADAEQELQKQFAAAAGNRGELDRLAARQDQLREQTERLLEELRRLAAEKPSREAQRAVRAMKDAVRAVRDGAAQRPADAAEDAIKALKELVRQLADERNRNEVELAMEQMAQLEELLRSLRDRQQKALDEARRIEEKLRAAGSLARSEAASLLDLARNQRLLESEAAGMAQKAAGAEVLHLALTSAVEKMHEAAVLLENRQPGGEAQQAQQAALKWLDQVLEALKKDPQAPGPSPPGNPGDQAKEAAGSTEPGASPAELRADQACQTDAARRKRSEPEGGTEGVARGRCGRRGPQAIGRIGSSAGPIGRPAPEAAADRRRSRSAGGPAMTIHFGFWILDFGLPISDSNPKSQVPNLTSQVSDLRSQIPNLKSQISNLRSQIPDPRSQIPNPRSQIPNLTSQIPDPRSQIPNPRSQIPDPRYQIPDPKAQVSSIKSRISNPKSKVQSPKSFWPIAISLVCLWWCGFGMFSALAQAPAGQGVPGPAKPDATKREPAKPVPLEQQVKELRQKLSRELGPAGIAEDENPLLQVARQMQQAESLLASPQPGAQTKQVQEQIVADLDRLLKSCQNSSSSPGGQSKPKPGSEKKAGQPGKPGTRPNPKARQSGAPAKDEPARRQNAADARKYQEFIAALPQREREQIQASSIEEFLPQV